MGYNREPHTRTLPVPVTEEEQSQAGFEAAKMQVEIDRLKTEIEAFAKPRKETIKDIEKPALMFAKIAATGFKDDKVECQEQWLDSLQIQVIRLDTGEVVEGPRPMTKDEIGKFDQQGFVFDATVEIPVVDGSGEATTKKKPHLHYPRRMWRERMTTRKKKMGQEKKMMMKMITMTTMMRTRPILITTVVIRAARRRKRKTRKWLTVTTRMRRKTMMTIMRTRRTEKMTTLK